MKREMYESMFSTENSHWYFRSKHEIVLSMIESSRTNTINKIVDFGCGCGIMLKFLSKYGEVTGIDYSSQALEYCSENFTGTLIQADLQNMHIGDKFDFGIALDVLEHIEDDVKAAKTIFNSMEQNGRCIFTVPAFQFLWSKHDENCMHKRRYVKKELRNLIENAGFKIVYISYYNFWLFPVIAILRKIFCLLHIDNDSEIENGFKDGFINTMLYKIFSSEKYLIKSGLSMPFGVSIICEAIKEEVDYDI